MVLVDFKIQRLSHAHVSLKSLFLTVHIHPTNQPSVQQRVHPSMHPPIYPSVQHRSTQLNIHLSTDITIHPIIQQQFNLPINPTTNQTWSSTNVTYPFLWWQWWQLLDPIATQEQLFQCWSCPHLPWQFCNVIVAEVSNLQMLQSKHMYRNGCQLIESNLQLLQLRALPMAPVTRQRTKLIPRCIQLPKMRQMEKFVRKFSELVWHQFKRRHMKELWCGTWLSGMVMLDAFLNERHLQKTELEIIPFDG